MTTEQPEVRIEDIESAPTNLPETASRDISLARFTELSDELIHLKLENAELRTNKQTAAELNKLIRPYANRAFAFMCAYCGFAGLVLILKGFGVLDFDLGDSVLEILIGSTAVSVIGLVGMVLTGIFVGARRS